MSRYDTHPSTVASVNYAITDLASVCKVHIMHSLYSCVVCYLDVRRAKVQNPHIAPPLPKINYCKIIVSAHFVYIPKVKMTFF